MENSDDYIEGTFNKDNPANQKEEFENTEVESLLDAFLEYEKNPTKNNRSELMDWIGSEAEGAKRYLEANKKVEQICAWKKICAEKQVKAMYSMLLEDEKAYEHACKMVKKLKKELFNILK